MQPVGGGVEARPLHAVRWSPSASRTGTDSGGVKLCRTCEGSRFEAMVSGYRSAAARSRSGRGRPSAPRSLREGVASRASIRWVKAPAVVEGVDRHAGDGASVSLIAPSARMIACPSRLRCRSQIALPLVWRVLEKMRVSSSAACCFSMRRDGIVDRNRDHADRERDEEAGLQELPGRDAGRPRHHQFELAAELEQGRHAAEQHREGHDLLGDGRGPKQGELRHQCRRWRLRASPARRMSSTKSSV